MVVLQIETIGTERVVRGFNRFGDQMRDLREPFQEISEDFFKAEEKNFRAKGTPQLFRPLSPKYAAWKKKHFPGKPIMRLTDRLINSLTGKNQADAQDTIRLIGKKAAEFGTAVPYAHRHQAGTKGMPKRKIVQLTEKIKRRWMYIMHQWVVRKAKEDLK